MARYVRVSCGWRGLAGRGMAVEARCRKVRLVLVSFGWSRRSCSVKDRYGGSGFGG